MFKKIKRYTSKCLSIVLSVTTLLITGMPNTMANKNTKTVQKTDSTASSFKKILKKHPILCTGAAILGTALIYKIISYAKSEWDLKQTTSKIDSLLTSKIDNLSPKEIDEAISKELNTYTGRAPDVFVYDQSLLQMDHRLLLRTLIQLNYLFEKYDKFTIDLINYKRHYAWHKQFNLSCSALYGNCLASTSLNVGIIFSSENYRNYKTFLYKRLSELYNKFQPPCDETMLVEGVISHEFGHLISYLFIINNPGLFYQYIQCSPDRILNELAKLIFGSYEKCFISEYGKKNGSEFIAEVFANLECNKPKNVDPLGRDLENFLINRAKYLSPEKANLRNIS